MATARTPALAVANIVTLFTVPAHVKGVLKSVSIDNQGGAQHTIYLRDDFTTDAAVVALTGVADPAAAQTLAKAQWTVGAGLTATIPADQLKGKEFLGTCKCYADGAEPLCIIIIDYDFE